MIFYIVFCSIKINDDIIRVGNIEIKKRKFHNFKYPINIKNVDIDKIIIFKKISFARNGFIYLTDYKDDN